MDNAGAQETRQSEALKRLQDESVDALIDREINPQKQSQKERTSAENESQKNSESGPSGVDLGGGGDAPVGPSLKLAEPEVIDSLMWQNSEKPMEGLGPSTLSLGLENIIREAAIPEEKSMYV